MSLNLVSIFIVSCLVSLFCLVVIIRDVFMYLRIFVFIGVFCCWKVKFRIMMVRFRLNVFIMVGVFGLMDYVWLFCF